MNFCLCFCCCLVLPLAPPTFETALEGEDLEELSLEGIRESVRVCCVRVSTYRMVLPERVLFEPEPALEPDSN